MTDLCANFLPSADRRVRGRLVAATATTAISLVMLAACAGLVSASPRTLHFSDCQAGAAGGCVPGSNGNPGTEAAPKRDLSGIDIGYLPPGTTLLFKRGGSWAMNRIELGHLEATPQTPIVFDAYGSGPAPLFRTAAGNAFQVGGKWGNTDNDCCYTFRNIKLDGLGTADWGFWLVQNTRGLSLENVEITRFRIAIHASGGKGPHGVTDLKVRNSTIRGNGSMGFLGTVSNSVFEGNLFEANNASGSGMEHAVYLSGGSNNTLRANRFVRNSVVNGVCTGGNVTVHGRVDGLLIENNLIEQDAGAPGCYGFSITAGYDAAESFRRVVVRGNTVVNVGYCAVCVNSAPGIVVENNRLINTRNSYQIGVQIPTGRRGDGDEEDARAVVRDNIVCQTTPAAGSAAVRVQGEGAQVSGNFYRTGADATTQACAR